jgi:hypothetical protein
MTLEKKEKSGGQRAPFSAWKVLGVKRVPRHICFTGPGGWMFVKRSQCPAGDWGGGGGEFSNWDSVDEVRLVRHREGGAGIYCHGLHVFIQYSTHQVFPWEERGGGGYDCSLNVYIISYPIFSVSIIPNIFTNVTSFKILYLKIIHNICHITWDICSSILNIYQDISWTLCTTALYAYVFAYFF